MIIKGIEFSSVPNVSSFLGTHKKTQIFDAKLFVSKRHIEHCVKQALKAFAQKRNISKSAELEFLLCLTGEKQVRDALKKAIASKKAVFVAWGNSYPAFKKSFKFKEFILKDKPDLDAIQTSATFWVKQ